MLNPGVMLSVLSLLHPAQVETSHVQVGAWRISRSLDKFTGDLSCRAGNGRMKLEGQALVIDFGPRADTDGAVYKIDEQAARPARGDAFNAQYHLRYVIDAPLDNPSAGRVALSAAELSGGRSLWIRVGSSSEPKRFDVSGVDRVMAAEADLGCP